MAGLIEGLMAMALVRWLLRTLRRLLFWFLVLSVGVTIFYRFVPVAYTPLMFARGNAWSAKKKWVPMEKMCPDLVAAAIIAEDQRFNEHWGFDFSAMWDAWKYNRTHSGHKRGASTISQQTAKNVFLYPARTYVRKILEAYFTVLIEVFWSKKRIVEVYLNVAEMGEGIYGVEAASQTYYGKSAANLNRDQAAALISCLPSPRKWSPLRPAPFVAQRIAWVKAQIPNFPPSKYTFQ